MSDDPLAGVNPESLDELFSRDPRQLGEADITKIVEALRKQRKAWKVAEAQGARVTRKAKAPAGPKPEVKSLKDLGL